MSDRVNVDQHFAGMAPSPFIGDGRGAVILTWLSLAFRVWATVTRQACGQASPKLGCIASTPACGRLGLVGSCRARRAAGEVPEGATIAQMLAAPQQEMRAKRPSRLELAAIRRSQRSLGGRFDAMKWKAGVIKPV